MLFLIELDGYQFIVDENGEIHTEGIRVPRKLYEEAYGMLPVLPGSNRLKNLFEQHKALSPKDIKSFLSTIRP